MEPLTNNAQDEHKLEPKQPLQQPPEADFLRAGIEQPHPMGFVIVADPVIFDGPQHKSQYQSQHQPQQIPKAYPGGYVDPEDPLGPEVKGFEFTEESVRIGFICKVYGILSCQLLITLAFIAVLNLNDSARNFMMRNPAPLIASIMISLVVLISMMLNEPLRRKIPINFILLGMFTLAESYVVAGATARYPPGDVFLAVLVTAAAVVTLTIFAFRTKYDFTECGGILVVCLLWILLIGLVASFYPSYMMTMVFSSVGAILFSFYIVYDTQLMMDKEHKYSISPEEYIFAALTLYLDIINLFLYILRLIGSRN